MNALLKGIMRNFGIFLHTTAKTKKVKYLSLYLRSVREREGESI
jgi:hypothetical protein